MEQITKSSRTYRHIKEKEFNSIFDGNNKYEKLNIMTRDMHNFKKLYSDNLSLCPDTAMRSSAPCVFTAKVLTKRAKNMLTKEKKIKRKEIKHDISRFKIFNAQCVDFI